METHVELRPRQRQRRLRWLGQRLRLKAPSVAAGIEEKASAVLEKRAMVPWCQASCLAKPQLFHGIIEDYSW